jgi:hypothetical protein
MIFVRWLLFLPVGLLSIGLAQLLTGTLAEILPRWLIALTFPFWGGFVVLAGLVPSLVAPDRKIGAAVVITVFVLLEFFALCGTIPGSSRLDTSIRILTDLFIIFGAIVPSLGSSQASSHARR